MEFRAQREEEKEQEEKEKLEYDTIKKNIYEALNRIRRLNIKDYEMNMEGRHKME